MPSKKKKYNARFPPARIKKIMQTDEDVGKVAAAVPVIISRSLELFIDSLIEKTASITRAKNAKTLSTSHIKQAIHSEKTFDFLRDLVANVPDHQAEEDVETGMGAVIGGQERKPRVAKPRKPREEGARGPGRPRKVKVEEKREEVEVEANDEDDEETESDEEQRSPHEDSSSSQNNTGSPTASMEDPSQGPSYSTPHQYQGTPGPMAGVSSQQFPPVSLHPPQDLPAHHQPSSMMSQDRAHSAMYPHASQQDKGNPNPNFLPPPPFNYHMHNMTFPGQYPYPPGSHPMGHMPPFVPHPNVGPYMGPGMTHFPPHYMMPGSPFMPPGVPVPPRTFSDSRDPYLHVDPSNNTEEASGPLDMSRSARSHPANSEYNETGNHRAESTPHLNSQHSPLQGSRDLNSHQKGPPGDRRSRSRSPVDMSVNAHCNSEGHNGQDSKQSKPSGFSTLLPCESSVNSKQTVWDNGEQQQISFPALSNIMKMNVKPADTNSEDDDYDS